MRRVDQVQVDGSSMCTLKPCFLEIVSKQTASNMDENTGQDTGNEDIQEVSLEMEKETRETEKRGKQSRKRKNNDDN